MNDDKFDFEDLKLYQKALDYIDFVYEITEKFPTHEQYGLTSQFRRAANSIALNTAEGTGGSNQEFLNFLRIAYRSTRECIVCTTIAFRRNYINKETNIKSRSFLTELAKMNRGLKRAIINNKESNFVKEPETLYYTNPESSSPNSELITPN